MNGGLKTAAAMDVKYLAPFFQIPSLEMFVLLPTNVCGFQFWVIFFMCQCHDHMVW